MPRFPGGPAPNFDLGKVWRMGPGGGMFRKGLNRGYLK